MPRHSLISLKFILLAGWLGAPLTSLAKENGPSLYDDLGGTPVLEAVTSHMLGLAMADPMMAPIFIDTNMERLEKILVVHLCHIAGGPCVYEGQDMRRAHDGLGIRTAHFNRLVENMQDAMDAQNIPFKTQNRLLARLAPFHDDVTGRSPVPPRMTKPSSYSQAPVTTEPGAD